MTLLNYKDGWKIDKYIKSSKPNKKITAILKNGDQTKQIHFGQCGSSTYRDLSKVGDDPIHNDKKKREAYRARHKGEGDDTRKYSAGWFSFHILW